MKLQYFGTAAAEAIPALFCCCETCVNARKTGGKEIRMRASAMIDDRLMIDFGPDAYRQMIASGHDWYPLTSLFITHSHEDHIDPGNLFCRRPGFSHLPEGQPPLIVYGNENVRKLIEPALCDEILFQRMIPFRPVTVEGYKVTALEAVHCIDDDCGTCPVEFEGKKHMRSEEALFYLFEKDGKSILYAHDTDEFSVDDLEYLKGRRIDIISLDCTNSSIESRYIGHMGAKDNLRMREKLLANGAADGHTQFISSHFSHNGYTDFANMQERLPGFTIAYDMLTVETI